MSKRALLSLSLSTTKTGMPHHQAGMLCRPADMHVSESVTLTLSQQAKLAAMHSMWLPKCKVTLRPLRALCKQQHAGTHCSTCWQLPLKLQNLHAHLLSLLLPLLVGLLD